MLTIHEHVLHWFLFSFTGVLDVQIAKILVTQHICAVLSESSQFAMHQTQFFVLAHIKGDLCHSKKSTVSVSSDQDHLISQGHYFWQSLKLTEIPWPKVHSVKACRTYSFGYKFGLHLQAIQSSDKMEVLWWGLCEILFIYFFYAKIRHIITKLSIYFYSYLKLRYTFYSAYSKYFYADIVLSLTAERCTCFLLELWQCLQFIINSKMLKFSEILMLPRAQQYRMNMLFLTKVKLRHFSVI